MKQITNKKYSIFTNMLILLLISAAVSVLLFFILQTSGEKIVINYLENSSYIEKANRNNVKELQDYICQKQISSRDTSELSVWIKKHQILQINIYKDGIQVFDSTYPDRQIWESEIAARNYDWEDYYPVEFSDGSAELSIFGAYDYQLYNYVLLIALLLSFALFLFIVLSGIKRRMDYIIALHNEVKILEGGNLDYPLSIKGKDELAVLASSMDSMRQSVRNLMRQEDELNQKYQKLVTEMAHDIRTPITSIMLYTEILNKGKYNNEEHLKNYLEKINLKALQMKFLTDQLFNCSLQAQDEHAVILEPPEQFSSVFFDILSECCNYLEQKGFSVAIENRLKSIDTTVKINTEYIIRIVDNIVSNIIKYAEPASIVEIDSVEKEGSVGLAFKNKVRKDCKKYDSNGIGLQNIQNMMAKMGGNYFAEQKDMEYLIGLCFPACSETNNENK